jgi:RNA polymerase sigma-70 factor (sigma-E family)
LDSGGGLEFAAFVRAHTSGLLRTAYLLTGSAAAAEDLVQDTFVRLYPKWHRVEAAEAPLAYVRRSMTNGFLNEKRRASSRDVTTDSVPDRVADYDAYAQLVDRDQVQALLARLPARQRAALVLRYFGDLPDDEIAEALDCRLGTVRSLVSRGLATLREHGVGEGPATTPERRYA